MRLHLLTALVACLTGLVSPCHAAEWLVTAGGLSPDQKLAVVVLPQKNEITDEADAKVWLIHAKHQKPIGILEEIDSSGGGFGKPATNVRCQWSPDSKLLLVNFRVGRLMHSFEIYRMKGFRAVPVALPDPSTHPKGRIVKFLTSTANPGSGVELSKDGLLIQETYGLRPGDGPENEKGYAQYGLKDFEGRLTFIYQPQPDGTFKLIDIKA